MSSLSDKQRVLAATDLVRLIGEQVTLKRKGREYTCLCPFHNDHNPSMYVVPSKQIYHCFVCGAGGDCLKFAMDYFKMEFREALQMLADRAGITLAPPKRREPSVDGLPGENEAVSRAAILNASAFACNFFKVLLGHAEHGKTAREVIERRAISPEMVAQFGLGTSPDRWDGLLTVATTKKLTPETLLAAGLAKRRDSGGLYDVFRNRLMFPIHDALGRVVAFGARKLKEDDEPKYLNSPETALFNKSATLYGLPFASAAIRAAGRAIVTEGYMDCIACHQAGVKNVVATLGTALTAHGVRVLRRLCDEVVLFFDGDDAGQRAADRAIEAFFAEPIEVKIATMTMARAAGMNAKDPDELLKLGPAGVDAFNKIITAARPALEFRFDRLRTQTAGLSATAKLRIVEDEITRLVELGLDRVAPLRKRLVIQSIARIMGVGEDTIVRALPSSRGTARRFPEPGSGTNEPIPGPGLRVSPRSAVEQFIALALFDPVFLLELEPAQRVSILNYSLTLATSPMMVAIVTALQSLSEPGEEFSTRDILGSLDDSAALQTAAGLAADVQAHTGGDPDQARTVWTATLAEVRRSSAMVTQAQASGDDWQRRIESIRVVTQEFGANRRTLPRAGPATGRPGGPATSGPLPSMPDK